MPLGVVSWVSPPCSRRFLSLNGEDRRRWVAASGRIMGSTILRVFLAGVFISLVGCSEKAPLPWTGFGEPAGETMASQVDIDCDDLPALTPEEEARAPFEISLEKGVPVEPMEAPRYAMLAGVTLSPA